MKLNVHVLCPDTEAQKASASRAGLHADVCVKPIYPVTSALAVLRDLAKKAAAPFLICRADVIFGHGIAEHVEQLLEELAEKLPNWAICGNRGVRWDARHVYDFTQSIYRAGLQNALCAHPVMSIDDNMLLVNPEPLRKHRLRAPAVPSLQLGALLSLECLQNGSLMAVSPRLTTVRGDGAARAEGALETQPAVQSYYRSSFLNHIFPLPDGELNFSELIDYSYISEPWRKTTQADVLALYDATLATARRRHRPSVTICCRTQFRRLELLERCVLSLSACPQYACGLADVHIRLITDQSPCVAEPIIEKLRYGHPGAAIECWFHQIRPGRHSRADLLVAAIERAETDYIWFIDDDDTANPPATAAIARCLVAGAPVVVVGSSVVVEEDWRPAVAGATALALMRSERHARYSAADIFRVLTGRNFIPSCGMVLPVPLLRQRLRNGRVLGDYNEDYFLLLLALTASSVEVVALDIDIASISLRDKENTGMQEDRTQWHTSYASFLLEVLNNKDGNSPFLWQQANSGLQSSFK
jgi:hypothetical protein